MAKKSDAWSMTVEINSHSSNNSLQASLSCEDVSSTIIDEILVVEFTGKSASDLRARYNSTMRSITAANEVLSNIW